MKIKDVVTTYIGQIALLASAYFAQKDKVMQTETYLQYIWLTIAMLIISITVAFIVTYKPAPPKKEEKPKKLQDVIGRDELYKVAAKLLEQGHKRYNVLADQLSNSVDKNKMWVGTAKQYVDDQNISYSKAEI